MVVLGSPRLVEPFPLWWRSARRPLGGFRLSPFRIQVGENLLDADPEDPLGPLRLRLIAARRSTAVRSSGSAAALASRPPLPRLAGVTRARKLLFGAKTPWKRVRLTRGFGTRAARRTMKSRGSKMTCAVPSRYAVC